MVGAESHIRFQPHARFGNGAGEFREFSVKADVDEEKLENSRFEVTIDVASIDTGIKKRDKHLRTADFFDVENHPRAALVLSGIRPLGEGTYEAEGELTIRGVAKPVVLPVVLKSFKEGRLEVEGETRIDRKDFNINYDSFLNPIKDEVDVSYKLVLTRE